MSMKTFLVESHAPLAYADDVGEPMRRAREAAKALRSAGMDVRYMRSSFLPADDGCLHWFRAECVELVAVAAKRASFRCLRIVETIEPAPIRLPAPIRRLAAALRAQAVERREPLPWSAS